MDPPPKMYEIGTLEGALEIVLSGFSTSSNFFGVESGVAFNVFNYRLISNPAVKSRVSFHAMPNGKYCLGVNFFGDFPFKPFRHTSSAKNAATHKSSFLSLFSLRRDVSERGSTFIALRPAFGQCQPTRNNCA